MSAEIEEGRAEGARKRYLEGVVYIGGTERMSAR